MMSYFVAKTLHIRPNEILDTWGVPELIVTFGEYANQTARQNFEEYKSISDDSVRNKIPRPKEYYVRFISFEE